MSNQEMQFADPDWRPSQKLDAKTGAQEQEAFIPEPINADSREQSQWRAMPPPPPQQEMYTGLPPYAGTAPGQMQGGQYRQRQYRRSGRGPWFWIIIALILISLMGGGFGSAFNRIGGPDRFGQSSVVEAQHVYTVGNQPTVIINDNNGAIHVQSSDSPNSVTVQDTKNPGFFGNQNDATVNYSQSPDGNTINVGVQSNGSGPVDLNVFVPQGTNLQLNTNSGDITIDGVSGQVALQTDSGKVTATNDTFSGTSTIKTNSGDINLTVPVNSAFRLNASTNSGSIDPGDLPGVNVQNNASGSGATASGNIGGNSQGNSASVTLTTDSGDIHLSQTS